MVSVDLDDGRVPAFLVRGLKGRITEREVRDIVPRETQGAARLIDDTDEAGGMGQVEGRTGDHIPFRNARRMIALAVNDDVVPGNGHLGRIPVAFVGPRRIDRTEPIGVASVKAGRSDHCKKQTRSLS